MSRQFEMMGQVREQNLENERVWRRFGTPESHFAPYKQNLKDAKLAARQAKLAVRQAPTPEARQQAQHTADQAKLAVQQAKLYLHQARHHYAWLLKHDVRPDLVEPPAPPDLSRLKDAQRGERSEQRS